MRNKYWVFGLFIVFMFSIITAQNNMPSGLSDKTLRNTDDRKGGVTGKVTDEKGEALVGANVIILESKLGTAAGGNGKYEIKNVLPGTYSVKFSFIGYKSITLKVTVVAGKLTELNAKLESESFEIGGIRVEGTSELMQLI